MKICAVIVSYNIGNALVNCINSIQNQVDELAIVDNGSAQKTIDILKSLEPNSNITVFYHPENIGIAGGFNTGVKYAVNKGYDWVITLDHDSIASPGMVQELLKAYNALKSRGQSSKAGILCPLLYDINANIYLTGESKSADDIVSIKMARTSGSLINRRLFNYIGLFNEDLFLYYVDDDFCLRARKAGYKIFIVKKAVLLHAEGYKEHKKLLWRNVYFDNYSAIANYYIFRNGIFIIKKYFGFDRSYLRIITFRMIADLGKIILFGHDKLNCIGQSLTGLMDGIIGKYGKKITT